MVVAGNHDLYAIKRIPECNAGFNYILNWYEQDYERSAILYRNKIWLYEDSKLPIRLSMQSVEFLRSFPEYVVMQFDGINFLFSHINYPDFTGSTIHFPKKVKDLTKHLSFMIQNKCLISVSGHGHPEGFAIVTEDSFKFHPFCSSELEKDTMASLPLCC